MQKFNRGELVRVTGKMYKGRNYHFFYVGEIVRVIGETIAGGIKCTNGETEQSIRPEDLEKIEP